jgi:proton glutamate symport protein
MIILGVIFGVMLPKFALALAPLGDLYLSLLKMVVYPILIVAIISSMANLVSDNQTIQFIKKVLIVFFILLFGVSSLSTVISLSINPGKNMSAESQASLGKILHYSELFNSEETSEMSFFSFFSEMIPENIFHALAYGASLKILFFSIFLGLAIGYLDPKNRERLIGLTDAFFTAFLKIIDWLLFLLPIGLFCLVASQIANVGIELIGALTKFIIAAIASAIVTIVLSSIIVWRTSNLSYIKALIKLKRALIIAFGTQSVFAALPVTFKSLESLGVEQKTINLVIPFGAVVMRFSMIIIYAVASIFAAQLYSIDISFYQMLLIVLLSVFAGVAGAGTPGIASMAFISIVITPLSIPSDAIIVFMLAVYPIVKPFTTTADLYANCAATSTINSFQQKK